MSNRLLNVCMIVCSCDNSVLEETILSWSMISNHFTILLNNYNKQTENALKKLQLSKCLNGTVIEIYYTMFSNFGHARNIVINLAPNNYKYTAMIDDSYKLVGYKSLKEELEKCNERVLSIKVKSLDKYFYPRSIIFKKDKFPIYSSKNSLKYEGKIHETLNVKSKHIIKNCYIDDIATLTGLQRTKKRLNEELNYIKQTNAPDAIFHIFGALVRLEAPKEEIEESFGRRMKINKYPEQLVLMSAMYWVYLHKNGHVKESVKVLLEAIDLYIPRNFEIYFYLFETTGKIHFLNKCREYLKWTENNGGFNNFNYAFDHTLINKIKETLNRYPPTTYE